MRIYLSIPFGSYLSYFTSSNLLQSVYQTHTSTCANYVMLCFTHSDKYFFKVKVLFFLLSYRYWQILRFCII